MNIRRFFVGRAIGFIVLFGIALLVAGFYALNSYIYKEKQGEKFEVGKTESLVLYEGGCFEYSHIATAEEPYNVLEKVEINIEGNIVEGVKSGTQSGPDMTNGYEGTLIGTYEKNIAEVIFSYVIEGSAQKEKEIYEVSENMITKIRYVLEEVDGVLVPDLNSIPQYIEYKEVACSSLE